MSSLFTDVTTGLPSMGNSCASLLGIKSLLVLCSNCQNVNYAFLERWLTQCLFTVFSEWHRNSKQGWRINLGSSCCSLFGRDGKAAGKGSVQMWQMEQKSPLGRPALVKTANQSEMQHPKKARQKSGSDDSRRIWKTQNLNNIRKC